MFPDESDEAVTSDVEGEAGVAGDGSDTELTAAADDDGQSEHTATPNHLRPEPPELDVVTQRWKQSSPNNTAHTCLIKHWLGMAAQGLRQQPIWWCGTNSRMRDHNMQLQANHS